jgi:hypothetical protein
MIQLAHVKSTLPLENTSHHARYRGINPMNRFHKIAAKLIGPSLKTKSAAKFSQSTKHTHACKAEAHTHRTVCNKHIRRDASPSSDHVRTPAETKAGASIEEHANMEQKTNEEANTREAKLDETATTTNIFIAKNAQECAELFKHRCF